MPNVSLAITPGGRLRIVEDNEATIVLSESAAATLGAAFDGSNADGLLGLVSHPSEDELPASFVYWRGFARLFFEAICHLGEDGFAAWNQTAPPAEQELDRLVVEAPPMRGLEFLSVLRLQQLWQE